MRKSTIGTVALALAGFSLSTHAGLIGEPQVEQCDAVEVASLSIEGYSPPATAPKAGTRDAMAELHQWLSLDAAAVPKQGLARVELTLDERIRIGEIETTGLQPTERRMQVGVGKELGLEIDLSAALAQPDGAYAKGGLRRSGSGFTWTSQVHSPGAHALRLMFTGLDLPEGAELYVYNKHGEAFGPYGGRGMDGSGELVSNTVTGDTALVQVHVAGALSKSEAQQMRFTLAEVGHIGPRFKLARRVNPDLARSNAKFCDYNATCVINGECASGWTPLGNVRNAVAHMLFRSGGSYYICSGGLINNSANDGRNLFLTANHCLNREREADSLETFFNFRAASCSDTAACDASYTQLRSSLPTTLGAAVLAASSSSDYSLLELDATPQASGFTPHYLGYSTGAIANTNGARLYRISHPSGAPQAWSTHEVDTGTGVCGTIPRGRFIYSGELSSFATGATEGGSSGSPVLNASGQIVGQLYGACGSNLNDECDNINNATVDGALANYYADVSQHLNPSGGGGGTNKVAHVSNIALSVAQAGRNKYAGIAAVTVVDAGGAAISGATVTGRFTFGNKNQNASGTTASTGVATLQSGSQNTQSFSFCVTGISGTGITYDSSANTETCDSR
jgi:lysyl endopeptidase